MNPNYTDIFGRLDYNDRRIRALSSTVRNMETGGYKVYTALLTQSGGNDPVSVQEDPLIIGVTYRITANFDNSGDFTNVGAPNNIPGTYFVATGTTPTSWGNTDEVELQYNTGVPVVTVLENTIGSIYWTYSSTGVYIANLTGAFPDGKTYQVIGDSYDIGSINRTEWNSTDTVLVQTLLYAVTSDDNLLNRTPIEIRVYN